MKSSHIVAACALAFLFAGGCPRAVSEELQQTPVRKADEKDQQQAEGLVKKCRDALAKGEKANAGSRASEAFQLDPQNRDAFLLYLFTSEGASAPLEDARLLQSFTAKVSFDFVETPLTDVMTFVQCISRSTVIVDPKLLENATTPEITLKVENVPLSEAVDAFAEQLKGKRAIHEGVSYITDPETAKAMKNDAGLCALRECTIEFLGFADAAVKPAFSGYAFSAPELIICANDDRLVLKIAGRIPLPADAAASTAEARLKHYREAEPPAWMSAMEKSLMKRFSFHSHDASVGYAVTQMKKGTRHEIVFDEKALMASKGAGMPFSAQDQPLCRTLNWAAAMLDYAVAARSNQILLAPKDQLAGDQNADQYGISRAAIVLQEAAYDLKTQFEGVIFREPKMGMFFIVANDAEGRELKLKGMVDDVKGEQNSQSKQ